MRLRCKYLRAGTATIQLEDGEQTYSAWLSYIRGDGFTNLVEATNLILSGVNRVECDFHDEQVEYRWLLETQDGTLRLRIFGSEKSIHNRLAESGELEFEMHTTIDEFARQVKMMMADLLYKHGGQDGFGEVWDYGFPSKAYQHLCELWDARKKNGEKQLVKALSSCPCSCQLRP